MKTSLRYFLPLFACLCAVYLFDGNLEGNELDTLALALHRIDPSFIPNDFRLSMAPGPRLPFQLILTPLLHVFGLFQISIIGRLTLYALFAAAYARIARKIGLDVAEALACGAIWIAIGCDICTGEFVITGVESKSLAYAGVLFAIDAGIDRRWIRAAACLGLAVTIHPAVGAWSTIAAVLAFWKLVDWRRALPVFLVTAAPGVALSVASLAHGSQAALGTWAYVYFRHPHHLVPTSFLKWPEGALRFAVALVIWARSFSLELTGAERALARFAQATIGVFIVGLAASLLPHAGWFLFMYPFRVGDTLFPLFALMLVTRRVLPNHSARRAEAIVIAAIAAIAAFMIRYDVLQDRAWAADKPRPAYTWIEGHTPKDALVLCAAGLDYAGLYMQRATVASAKAVPTAPDDIAAWYERLVELNGGAPITEHGFQAFVELERSFEELSPEVIARLVAKYHASYVLWPTHGTSLPYAKVYDDGVWSVLQVR